MKKLFLLSLFVASVACAQQNFVKGYIVQLNGDTVKGEIKVNPKKELDLFAKVAFKEANGMQKTYKPGKIKAYGFDKNIFISAKNNDEDVFFKVLSSGVLDLYTVEYEVLQMNEVKTKHDLYVKKKGALDFIKIKHHHYKKQLAEQIADASHIVKEMEENKDFEFDHIEKVVNEYNTWAKARDK